MKKEKVLETVNEFPQEFDLDELIDRLVFIEKVERGLKQLDEGKTLTHEQVKAKVREWQK